MCDTFVSIQANKIIFGKNSDRDPNEAQLITSIPRRTYEAGCTLRCTWKSIPQVEATHAVLLSRPFWMWGAEMGVNEHGVAIGNEAVFTDQPLKQDGLTGMDLVRLGLERSTSAKEAVDVIAQLIAAHGQGGRCGYSDASFRYHNSFLIADFRGAWVLETADQKIAVEFVERGARAISNGLTIPSICDRADRVRSGVAQCKARRGRVEHLAKQATGPLDAMKILRDHGEGNAWPVYHWINGAMSAPCMHAGGIVAGSQTVGSWVSELTESGARHFATGTAAPCLSLFRPVHFGEEIHSSSKSWWRFEKIHRAVIKAPSRLVGSFLQERDALEKKLCESGEQAESEIEEWLSRWERWLIQQPIVEERPWWLRRYWSQTEIEAKQGDRLPARKG
jgi:secernin